MSFFFLLGLICAVRAQFESTEYPRWMGPFADHKIGHLVEDTPEVAAAKIHHIRAHSQIKSILPELPPQVRYQPEATPPPANQPFVPVPQVTPPPPPPFFHHQPTQSPFQSNFPMPMWSGPQAKHTLGQVVQDTDEVAQAKQQHSQAYAHFKGILPQIPEHHSPDHFVPSHNDYIPNQNQFVPQARFDQTNIDYSSQNNFNTQPQIFAESIPRSDIGETPEVEEARKAHLAAHKAVVANLPVDFKISGQQHSGQFPVNSGIHHQHHQYQH